MDMRTLAYDAVKIPYARIVEAVSKILSVAPPEDTFSLARRNAAPARVRYVHERGTGGAPYTRLAS